MRKSKGENIVIKWNRYLSNNPLLELYYKKSYTLFGLNFVDIYECFMNSMNISIRGIKDR
jgi:hypothetical protein